MANIHDLFPSRFLKSLDLRGGEPTVTIARVAFEVVGHGPKAETLPILYVAGQAKGIKLNKTLAVAIAAIAGSPDTDAWPGTVLTLYGTTATFGKEAYPVVRVKAGNVGIVGNVGKMPTMPTAASTARQARPVAVPTPPPPAPPVVAPAASSAAPEGFHAWLDTLRGAALQGLPGLERAWVDAPKTFRLHLAATAPGAQAELKAIAGRLAAGAGRTS